MVKKTPRKVTRGIRIKTSSIKSTRYKRNRQPTMKQSSKKVLQTRRLQNKVRLRRKFNRIIRRMLIYSDITGDKRSAITLKDMLKFDRNPRDYLIQYTENPEKLIIRDKVVPYYYVEGKLTDLKPDGRKQISKEVDYGYTTHPIDGKLIPIDGFVYKRLVKNGYKYEENGRYMFRPKKRKILTLHSTESKSNKARFYEYVDQMEAFLEPGSLYVNGRPLYKYKYASTKQILRMLYTANMLGDDQEEYTTYVPSNNIVDGKQVSDPKGDNYPNLDGKVFTLVIYKSAFDILANHSTDENPCFYNCVKHLFNPSDIEWVKNYTWVNKEQCNLLCKRLNLTLELYLPNGALFYEGGYKHKKNVKLLYNNNHLRLMNVKGKRAVEKELRRMRQPSEIQWINKKDNMWKYVKANSQIQLSHKDKLIAIFTGDSIIKKKFPLYEKYPNCYSTAGALYSKFRKIYDKPKSAILEKLGSDLVMRPIYYDNGVDDKAITPEHLLTPGEKPLAERSIEKFTMYDQRKAFINYRRNPYYSGFPDRSTLFPCKFDHDLIMSGDYEGFVYIENLKSPYPYTMFTAHTLWIPFPVYRYVITLKDHQIFALHMIIGKRIGDIFKEFDFINGGAGVSPDSKVYVQMIGRMWMTRGFDSIVTNDSFVYTLCKDSYEFIKKGKNGYNVLSNKKTIIPEYPEIAGYIMGYQQITLWKDLISKIENKINIARLWVDGVYIYKYSNIPIIRDLDKNVWHDVVEKRRTVVDTNGWPYYYYPDHLQNILPAFDPIFMKDKICILGPPGSGKTTYLRELIDTKTCLIAPTWIAALFLEPERAYTVKKATIEIKKKIFKYKGYNKIIVDEISMSGISDIDLLLTTGLPIILAGDFYQIPPVKRPVITRKELYERGFQIKEYTKLYRYNNQKTRDMILALRKDITASDGIIPHYNKCFRHWEPLIKNNERTHMLVGTNNLRIQWNRIYCYLIKEMRGDNAKFVLDSEGLPIYVGSIVMSIDKYNRSFRNQEVGIVLDITSCGYDVYINIKRCFDDSIVKVDNKNLKIGWALTFHRSQSQTYRFPYIIDKSSVFEVGQLYTGISRCVDIDDVSFL